MTDLGKNQSSHNIKVNGQQLYVYSKAVVR